MSASCRSCGAPLTPFMSLGKQPVSQARYTADAIHDGIIDDEPFYNLDVAVCPSCSLFQIMDQPSPEVMFDDDYPYYTSTSKGMAEHFGRAADLLRHRFVPEGGRVVEIGSNDGCFLRHIAGAGVSHLGIEPASRVAEVARAAGVRVRESFFDEHVADEVRQELGPVHLVYAANVIAHIPDVGTVGRGVARLLDDDGVFVFEVAYLGDVLRNVSLDQIYDEHVFTFSVLAARNVFARCGLDLIDLEPLPVHGGSMRFFLAPAGKRVAAPIVGEYLERERAAGFDDADVYERFRHACEITRNQLRGLVDDLAARGAVVAGYGATAKSTTLLNYCGLTARHIAFISDNTPAKIGKVSPGVHIPIVSPEEFRARRPDYALLLAWNHRAEIEAKEHDFGARGGKWILHVPEVQVT
ncbi:MAG TPA: class I SAM-dependent methyltransferase [Alphaproteobacteria bacterium]